LHTCWTKSNRHATTKNLHAPVSARPSPGRNVGGGADDEMPTTEVPSALPYTRATPWRTEKPGWSDRTGAQSSDGSQQLCRTSGSHTKPGTAQQPSTILP